MHCTDHLSFHCFDEVLYHCFTQMQLDLLINVIDQGSRFKAGLDS